MNLLTKKEKGTLPCSMQLEWGKKSGSLTPRERTGKKRGEKKKFTFWKREEERIGEKAAFLISEQKSILI